MRKALDIVGLPVIDVHTGNRVGVIKDMVFSQNLQALGVLLETRTWLTSPRWIEWDRVSAFGEDAVLVPEEDFLLDFFEEEETFQLRDGKRKWIGLPVLTKNGQEIGVIQDVYFGEKMDKRIVGFEISEGFLSDVTEGRKWLPFPDDAVKGDDAFIVPVHYSQEVKPYINLKNG